MDPQIIEKLRFAQQVKDRVALQAGSGARAVHCWYCGAIRPWFSCECPKARAAQKARDLGKRDGYPRFNPKTNRIENPDEETIQFNETLGFKRVTPAPVTLLAPPKRNAVTPKPDPVTPALSPAAGRMRRKRERDRAAKITQEPKMFEIGSEPTGSNAAAEIQRRAKR